MHRLIYTLGLTGLSADRGMWQRPSGSGADRIGSVWLIRWKCDEWKLRKSKQNKQINRGERSTLIHRSTDPNGFEGYVFVILKASFNW